MIGRSHKFPHKFFYVGSTDHLCCGNEGQPSWCRLRIARSGYELKTFGPGEEHETLEQDRPRYRRYLWHRTRSCEVVSGGGCYCYRRRAKFRPVAIGRKPTWGQCHLAARRREKARRDRKHHQPDQRKVRSYRRTVRKCGDGHCLAFGSRQRRSNRHTIRCELQGRLLRHSEGGTVVSQRRQHHCYNFVSERSRRAWLFYFVGHESSRSFACAVVGCGTGASWHSRERGESRPN